MLKDLWNKFSDKFGDTIFHPQFIMFRYTREAVRLALRYAKGNLIDIGCGNMPYRSLIEPKVKKYIGLDHPSISKLYKPKNRPEIYADITKKLPIKNNSFDIALMLQVMEYLQNPEKAIINIKNILKPGGFLIISSPFLYPLHDIPFDRTRLTETYLKNMIEESGLKIIKIEAQGNFIAFWLQSLEVFLFKRIFNIFKQKKNLVSIIQLILLAIVSPIIIIFGNLVYLVSINCERKQKYPNYFPLNYLVVAKKQIFRI